MKPVTLRRFRSWAKLSLVILLILAVGWLWRCTAMLSEQALLRRYALTGWAPDPWQSEVTYYTYLFPQSVVAGQLAETFLRDFPSKEASPFLLFEELEKVTVLQYFDAIKGALDDYHLKFGTYPDADNLPPVSSTAPGMPGLWPSLENARCRYVRLTKDGFLLGWVGPDEKSEELESVLRHIQKSYGLIRLGDDWWNRCEYFDFAKFRNYQKLIREVTQGLERILKAKGIDVWKETERFQLAKSDTRGKRSFILYHPVSWSLLGGILLSGFFLLTTKEKMGGRQ